MYYFHQSNCVSVFLIQILIPSEIREYNKPIEINSCEYYNPQKNIFAKYEDDMSEIKIYQLYHFQVKNKKSFGYVK